MNISTNNQEVIININGVNYSWSMFVNGFKYRFLDDKIQEITTIKKENKKINNMFPAYYKSIRSNLVVLATGSTSGIVVIGNNHHKLGFMSSTWVDFNGDSDWIKINQDEFNKIKAEQNTSDPTNSKYNSLQLHCYEQSQEINELHGRIKLLEEAGDRMFEIGKRIVHQNGEDMYWIRKLEEELTEWIATKEAKP
jgi:hypothetical protein